MTAPPRAADPSDQAVRNAAIRDLDSSIFLQAGAGTGKTSVLVGRVVEAVCKGRADLREIVAITFTEKAAGELRARVRDELHATLHAADAEEAKRLRRAIRQVDSAHIETIHAFASSLLRERPLEASLDPSFTVHDAVGEQLEFEQDWQDWLWAEEDSAARPRIERCLRLGLSLDHLRNLAHSIAEFRDLNARAESDPPPAPRTVLTDRLSDVRALQTLAAAAGADHAARVDTMLEQLQSIADLPDTALEAELVELRLPKPVSRRARRDVLVHYAEAAQRMRETQQQYAEAVRAHALAQFVEIAASFVQEAAQRRHRSGVLTFEDLLIEARDLIARQPRVRNYFRERFRFILVDEFQDTDPLQAEIILLLAAGNETADWRKVDLIPGRLFLVGDPKQSIYRFRRADIDIYAEVEGIFERHHARDSRSARIDVLEVNFRSRPEMVAWHNHVFGVLIQRTTDFPHAQPDYQALIPYRDDDGFAVLHLLPNTGVSWNRLEEARRDEAHATVRFIETVVGTKELPLVVHDRASEAGTRRPRYRDICLLVRKRTALEIYSQALDEAGIPYHLDSGRGFFLQQEIRDAAALLTCLDDPSDEVALVATLKSAPFAASDLELLEFVQASGRFQLADWAIPPSYQGPLRGPLDQLRTLQARKAEMSLPAFVDHVLRETHLLEIQLARRSPQCAANLELIVQRAADFAANEVDSLRPFVRWLGTQRRTDLAEAESPVTEVEDDVVRILTIHQAKGLEFPIVVLTNLAAGSAPDRAIAVFNREAGRIDFQVGPRDARFETPGFPDARARQVCYEEAEERRLLYVAATRARDYLVLPRFFTERSRGYHAEFEEALPGWTNPDYEVTAPGAVTCRVEHLVHARQSSPYAPVPDVPALHAAWQAAHAEALAKGAPRQQFIVPSRLGHDLAKLPRETEPRDHSAETVDHDISTDSAALQGSTDVGDNLGIALGSSDGRDRGILLHDALQRADFDDLDTALWAATTLCYERGREDLTEAVQADLRTTFASDLIARVRAARRVERELPLVMMEPERVIEGYVDLTFEEDAGWILVDYKSDRDPTLETITGYEEQVRAYAEAFRSTGAPLAGAYLLFTATGMAHPVPCD